MRMVARIEKLRTQVLRVKSDTNKPVTGANAAQVAELWNQLRVIQQLLIITSNILIDLSERDLNRPTDDGTA